MWASQNKLWNSLVKRSACGPLQTNKAPSQLGRAGEKTLAESHPYGPAHQTLGTVLQVILDLCTNTHASMSALMFLPRWPPSPCGRLNLPSECKFHYHLLSSSALRWLLLCSGHTLPLLKQKQSINCPSAV